LASGGLPKPTWVKPIIGTLTLALVDRRIGKLAAGDYSAVKAALRELIVAKFLA
jgi:hypothetical protein